MQTVFDEAEYTPYAGTGTSTITGQAFLKTRAGEVRLGAGNTVELVPLTPYTRERLNRATLGGQHLEPRDPRLAQYVRTTVADGNGNFEFRNVPAGDYVALCLITWEYVASAYSRATTGGQAYGIVKVGPGETVKVVVTR